MEARTAIGLARMADEFLCKDDDGQLMLDPLGEAFRKYVAKDQFDEPIRKAHRFVRQEAERFHTEGNSRLADRYSTLLGYFESRLPIWGLNDDKDPDTRPS